MQHPPDPLDAAALAMAVAPGQRRHFLPLLEIDWDRDGNYDHPLSDLSAVCEAVVVSRELADQAPGAELVSTGASGAQLTVTLGGTLTVSGQPWRVVDLFDPYNSDGPLYGVEIADTPILWTILTRTSRGLIPTRQFTGWIDTPQVDAGANTVTLTCLDAIRWLTGPAWWQRWAVDARAATTVGSTAPQRALASSVIDRMCDDAGLRTRPPAPWEADPTVIPLLDVPLHGSLAPVVGRVAYTPDLSAQPTTAGHWMTPGPFGGVARRAQPLAHPGAMGYYPSADIALLDGRVTSITCWMWLGDTAPAYNPDPTSNTCAPVARVWFGSTVTNPSRPVRVSLAADGQHVQAHIEPGNGTREVYSATVGGTDAWRFVHLIYDSTVPGHRVQVSVDGTEVIDQVPTAVMPTTTTSTDLLNVTYSPAEPVIAHLIISPAVHLSDVRIYQELGAATAVPETTVTVGAEIDPALNELTHLPVPEGSRWDVIQAVTAAEYAALTVFEDGTLVWANRRRVRAHTAGISFELSPEELSAAGLTTTTLGTANTALCTARPAQAAYGLVLELQTPEQITAPPGVTVWEIPGLPEMIAADHWTTLRQHWIDDGSATRPWRDTSIHGGVVVYQDNTEESGFGNMPTLYPTVVMTHGQAALDDRPVVRMQVTNTAAKTIQYRLLEDEAAGSDPQPALRVAGLRIQDLPEQTSTVISQANVDHDGARRELPVGGTVWHQHLPSVEATARWVLRRATQTIPVLDSIQVPGDPRRQLGDGCRLRLSATGGMKAWVTGITRSWSEKGGLLDDLQLRVAAAPRRWILGESVLGESTILG